MRHELEATSGWIGYDPDVLAELADDKTSCTIMRDPNKILATAGFPSQDDDEPANHLAQLTFSQGAAVALHAATDINLTDDMITNPWTGGLTQP